jgi:uncharacterized membrane protein YeaQ/YmgE (transglycosylase-associated protein family)
MDITLGEVIVWVVIGALAGSAVAALVTRSAKGYGILRNVVLGMAGAVIGGILVDLTNIHLTDKSLTFELMDVIAAVVGSVLLLIAIAIVRRKRGAKAA